MARLDPPPPPLEPLPPSRGPKLIGTVQLVRLGGLLVAVAVLDWKPGNAAPRIRVRPIAGSGAGWIAASAVVSRDELRARGIDRIETVPIAPRTPRDGADQIAR